MMARFIPGLPPVVSLERSPKRQSPTIRFCKSLPNDLIVLTYVDTTNATGETRKVMFKARAVEGSLGRVKVSQTFSPIRLHVKLN